jgi:hypothetical protein
MRRTQPLFTLLAAFGCFVVFVRPVHAQVGIGAACTAAATLAVDNTTSPGDLFICNGTSFALGLVFTSGGLVGVGTTPNAGAALDLGSANSNSLLLPSGTSAQRPTPTAGMIRYNSTVPQVEAYYSGAWNALAGSGGSSTITLGNSASATNPQRAGDATTGLFSPTAGAVAVASGASEIMRVNATGLGIGSTVPAAALDVTGQVYSRRSALTYASTITVNWQNGNVQSVTLTGNPTITFSNGQDGGRYILIVEQDGTGSRTVTWSNANWPGGTAPTLTTTASKWDYITFIYNGVSSTYDGVAISQNF